MSGAAALGHFKPAHSVRETIALRPTMQRQASRGLARAM